MTHGTPTATTTTTTITTTTIAVTVSATIASSLNVLAKNLRLFHSVEARFIWTA
jgi:hypothetical protein